MSIEIIIEKCGGVDLIASNNNLTEQAIRLWSKNGIPEKHWASLLELSKIKNTGVTVNDLFNANQNSDDLGL